MKIQRTERHIFKTREYDDLCFKSKNLYNYCNYILRQVLTGKHDNIPEYRDLIRDSRYVNEYDLINRLTKVNQADYILLPRQTSQQVILLLCKNWKSFVHSIKLFTKDKSKFKRKPKLPGYKNKLKGKNIVIFTNQNCRLKENHIHFPRSTNLSPIKTKVTSFQQVRIIPQQSCYIVEIVYRKEVQECKSLKSNLYLGIDLGVNNFATCVDNSGNKPFIINGKILKSINQYYNKQKARLMSYVGDRGTSKRIEKLTFKRNNKIHDYMHKTSRFVVDYCVNHKIKNIVIGYNKEWKQEVNIGRRNNQNFVTIPYLKLVRQLQYKAEEVGINVILNEESYTSKCDALALEPLEKQALYLGTRIKRGLFKSSVGKVVNSDVNGALNILRKVISESFIKKIIDRGCVFQPNRFLIY